MDQNPADNPTRELEKSLRALATAMQTPVVPGELVGWLDGVKACGDAVELLLHRNIKTVHEDEYEQILKEDPDSGNRVDALRKGDEESLTQFEAIKSLLAACTARANRKGPDEVSVSDDLKRLTDLGVQFVNQAQKQEIGRKTWLQEAFHRERGTGG